ncbi:hypothetical protein [Clavibacter tessellarius]|uniref:hypothetical protein n=1 Tax=Clavibacter tessellarius TaxID=31965 RepID=UPI003249B09E
MVQRHGVGVRVAGGDEQELVGARERRGQRGGVGVVAAADLDAAVGEGPRPFGIAGDDDEARSRGSARAGARRWRRSARRWLR